MPAPARNSSASRSFLLVILVRPEVFSTARAWGAAGTVAAGLAVGAGRPSPLPKRRSNCCQLCSCIWVMGVYVGWKRGIYVLAFPDLCCKGVLGGFFESNSRVVSDSAFLFLLSLFPVLFTLRLKVSPHSKQEAKVKQDPNASGPNGQERREHTFRLCSVQARYASLCL